MTSIIAPSRRSFITGLAALITAPAIVRAGSLMPVKVMEWETGNYVINRGIVQVSLNGGPWIDAKTIESLTAGRFIFTDAIPVDEWSDVAIALK